MTYNNYLPEDERYDDSKLNGIYKVSFEIKVKAEDELSLSDVTQALTEGLDRGFGEGFVEKVAELAVEKITKKSEKTLKVLKVGDTVYIKETIKVKANIYSDDGYLFTGKKTDISETISENVDLAIEAGSIGYVNKIANDVIEVVDLDRPVEDVNIDLITVKAEQIEKIDSEEVK